MNFTKEDLKNGAVALELTKECKVEQLREILKDVFTTENPPDGYYKFYYVAKSDKDLWICNTELPDRIKHSVTVTEFYKQNYIPKEKKLKGYKLNGVASARQVAHLLNFGAHEDKEGIFLWPNNPLTIKEAKRLGILDLWFTPVYEEEKPTEIEIKLASGESVKVTKNWVKYPDYKILINTIKEISASISYLESRVRGVVIGNSNISKYFTIKDIERVIEVHKTLQ